MWEIHCVGVAKFGGCGKGESHYLFRSCSGGCGGIAVGELQCGVMRCGIVGLGGCGMSGGNRDGQCCFGRND